MAMPMHAQVVLGSVIDYLFHCSNGPYSDSCIWLDHMLSVHIVFFTAIAINPLWLCAITQFEFKIRSHFVYVDTTQKKRSSKWTHVVGFISEILVIPEALNGTWALCGSAWRDFLGGGQHLHCRAVGSSFSLSSSHLSTFSDHLNAKYVHPRQHMIWFTKLAWT